MGFRICYVAAQRPATELTTSLGLKIIGQDDEMPEGAWWVANLKQSGWSVLWSEDEEFGARSQELLAETSKTSDLIHCEVNETCMWSAATYWSDGKPVWTVTHAGDGDDIYDLTTEGTLPAQFADIKQQHFLKQEGDADCDQIFEIPLELARSFIGFRHEDVLEPDDVDTFYEVSSAPRKASFFAKVLGRS